MSESEIKAPAIGIDLGTTYCCVAVFEYGQVNIIHNSQGKNTTASYITYTDSDVIVGDLAKEMQYTNLGNTIYDVKRLIGRKFNDPKIQSDRKSWPFEIAEEGSKLKIRIERQNESMLIYPEELHSRMLRYLKSIAEDYLDMPVEDVVITVPAYFTNSQRQTTELAAKLAGFHVLRILNEPTAAAIAYGLNRNDNQKILVYDLGGGTFDVSIIEINKGKYNVLGIGGNNHLGGEDFNRTLVDYFAEKILSMHKIDIRSDKRAMARLLNKCEELKLILSNAKQTKFDIQCLSGDLNFASSLTREEFERLNENMFQMTIYIVNKCLKDANLNANDISNIVMVGGSSRIPRLQSIMQDYFGKKMSKVLNPDEAVARGAALLASHLKYSTMPKEITLQDVTPQSLGISVVGEEMFIIIKKNSKIPITKSHTFKTTEDYQSTMKLDIYEGEDEMIRNNHLLGKFSLNGVTEDLKGLTQCEVIFAIDINGILTVKAREINTERVVQKSLSITKHECLCEDELISIIENLTNIT